MIKDFNYYAPTRVVFGRNAEEQLPLLVKANGGSRVLVHYGSGSALRSGLLDSVFLRLKEAGIDYVYQTTYELTYACLVRLLG
jgi:alcohol dehydrogenase YqhD (iron-dependent ADH family)